MNDRTSTRGWPHKRRSDPSASGVRKEWKWPEEAQLRLESTIIAPEAPVAEALARLDAAGTGVLLVTDPSRRLLGVLTDGDIRRHVLSGESLDCLAGTIAGRTPLVAQPGVSPAEALRLMDTARDFIINHLPLVAPDGTLVDLLLRSDLTKAGSSPVSAVIMAGGLGSRLRPLTDATPKPMLPIGDRPLLELMIQRLREAGVHDVSLTTHYLAEQISSHFGNGEAFGVSIHYVPEDRPLGTAGALAVMERPTGPVLVLNGDVLTAVNFDGLLAYHREHRADATVAVRKLELQVPYGVIECAGPRVCRLREKPVQQFMVNAGVYLLEPATLGYIPPGQRFDMTDLIQRLLDEGRTVVSFPIVEYWLDIGRPADYAQAQADLGPGES
jgi:dTDP-glucose pyrophosphorylase/CBS domain-containing protein